MKDLDVVVIYEVTSSENVHSRVVLEYPDEHLFESHVISFQLVDEVGRRMPEVASIPLVSNYHPASSSLF